MNRTQTLDSRLNIEKGTSPSTPRGPAPSINGHVDYRNADFGENIETRAPRVVIHEDRDQGGPQASACDPFARVFRISGTADLRAITASRRQKSVRPGLASETSA